MIQSVTVKPETMTKPLVISLTNPYETGLAIGSISGIDPGQASINMTEVASADGAYYSSARLSYRNIVLSMIVLDDWPTANLLKVGYKNAIEFNRHRLYTYFPLKKKITLGINTDARKVDIEGYVESLSTGIFSSRQAAQVSILCPFPYFRDIENNVESTGAFGTSEKLFEFPMPDGWSNEGLIKRTELGLLTLQPQKTWEYIGDCETGFYINIHFKGATDDITIYDLNRNTSFSLDHTKIESIIGSTIENADDIYITSVTGAKSVIYTKNGITYNILNAVKAQSVWPKLYPGENTIQYYTSSGLENILMSIRSDIYYEGI